MITLEVLAGEKAGATFELDLPLLTLGRAPSNQVVLSDYHLSGEHGQIFREDDRYIYRDLRSTNGSRVRRGEQQIALDDGTHETLLSDGDELLLGDPAQPVIVRCRVRIEDDGRGKQEIIARRELSELPEVQGKIERDPVRAAALYNVAKKLGRRGLDLAAVFEGVSEAIFELLTPKAGHVGIDLADDGRMNTVFTKSLSGGRAHVSRSVVRTVQREKGALIVRDVEAELPTSSQDTKALAGIIGVPLWDGETIRGVIQVGDRARGVFLDGDLDLVTAVANMATLAIENARLVQRLRLAEEKLRGEEVPEGTRREAPLRQHHRRVVGDGRDLQAAREGHRHARHRLHRGRDRHRQGADRLRDPLPGQAARQAVRRAELRGDAGEPARVGAVRPQEGRVHRRRPRQEGPVRDRRRRHAVPRRDRRDAA